MTDRRDIYGMDEARVSQRYSKDPSTQVGCAIIGPDGEVRAKGRNGFPRKCRDDAEIYADRPRKHLRVVHAEANAVAAAARVGTPLRDSTAYVTAPCCSQCAALLIQAGISRVVWPAGVELRADWAASAAEARILLIEAGIPFDEVDYAF
jgi:dCMP deaminase